MKSRPMTSTPAQSRHAVRSRAALQHRKEIVDFTLKNYLPSSFFAKEAVEAGGLMSYGANWPDAFRRGATTVDKICEARQAK